MSIFVSFRTEREMIRRCWNVLYIHASSTRIPREYKANQELMSLVDIEELSYGNIICCCELTDCVLMTDSFIEEIMKNRNEYISPSG